MSRTILLALALGAFTLPGCTSNRVASEITTGLEWAGLRSHSDMASSNRWQLVPGTRIQIEEQEPASDTVWIRAARDGMYRVFQPPGAGGANPPSAGGLNPQRTSDLLLRVVWPQSAVSTAEGSQLSRIGNLIPDARGRVHIRLFLCDDEGQRVVQSTDLVVDPHWFSFDGARPDQIEHAFAAYARSLAGRS